MDTHQQSGQARSGQRPFLAAQVLYTSTGGDALTRGQQYAATITALDDAREMVSLHITAPNAKFDLAGVRFSPTSEVGCWTWPTAG